MRSSIVAIIIVPLVDGPCMYTISNPNHSECQINPASNNVKLRAHCLDSVIVLHPVTYLSDSLGPGAKEKYVEAPLKTNRVQNPRTIVKF